MTDSDVAFRPLLPMVAACLALLAVVSPAAAASLRLAVIAPAGGNLAILGDQIRAGARLAAAGKAELVEINESCDDGSGPALAQAIAAAQAAAAIGFLCAESLEGGLPVLAQAKIPAITLSVRSPVLMEDALKHHWPLFRLAPTAEAERAQIVQAIFSHWKDKPVALLDDGTILSRETVEAVREMLEQKGMKIAFLDNFRPAQEVQTQLVRRLAKAGASHVYVAGDRNDMAVIARDAKAAKLDLVLMGGDAINGADLPVPLEKGVLAVTVPAAETRAEAAALVKQLAGQSMPAEGYVLPAHAAVTIAIAAAEIAGASGAPLADALVDTPFDTALGEIRFDKAHELANNPFRLLEWDGSGFAAPAVKK